MGDAAAWTMRGERTVCPFCSCGCGLYLTGSSQHIEGVGPSEHHPISRGRLCARGWSAHEASLWGPRLRTPLLRRDGELRPATWDQALGAAIEGLSRLRDAGRPLGVLISGRSSNEESFLAAALARSALRTPHLDAGLRAQWSALLSGLGGAGRTESGKALAAVEGSDLVVLLEDDLAVTHPRVALAVLRALRRGGRLVTLGWQRTSLSTLATCHVPLDGAAPLATLAGLRAQGELAELMGAARRPTFVLAPFTAEPDLLRDAAALMAELAGALADAVVLPLPIRANTRGSLDMGVAPDCLPGALSLEDDEARARLARVWGSNVCRERGADAEAMPGAVAGLVVVGEEPTAYHRSPGVVREQLEGLEQLVVVDAFLGEAASRAHVVLPMAAFGEAEGTFTGLEDRAQSLRPFVPPPSGVRHGWEILAGLLEGLGSSFHPRTLADLQGAIAQTVPGYASLTRAQPDDGWLLTMQDQALGGTHAGNGARGSEAGTRPPADAAPMPGAGQLLLRRAGAFDWSEDPLVRYSPTLRREAASQARRYPQGLVALSPSDAGALKVREGWTVRLRTVHGEARAAVTVRAGLEPGLLLVPYAFREQLGQVLGADGVAEVEIQPA